MSTSIPVLQDVWQEDPPLGRVQAEDRHARGAMSL